MATSVRAGALYFLIVFAVGFVLGTFRVLVVIPLIGEVRAVLFELPVILAASWFAVRWLIDRCRVADTVLARATMGAVAFFLLMLAETALGRFAFQIPFADQVAALGTVVGALGLLGQVLFGLLPMAVRARTS